MFFCCQSFFYSNSLQYHNKKQLVLIVADSICANEGRNPRVSRSVVLYKTQILPRGSWCSLSTCTPGNWYLSIEQNNLRRFIEKLMKETYLLLDRLEQTKEKLIFIGFKSWPTEINLFRNGYPLSYCAPTPQAVSHTPLAQI
jgi:hypothetical protein